MTGPAAGDEPVLRAETKTSLSSAWAAAGWYLIATIGLTWPLLPGLLHDVPADLGDSLLNCWILHWDATHILRFLSGDLGALRGFWNGNIFYPSPLALAYSEHLVPQAIAILPVYAVTRNVILCYNLLFLSTFVLSGLGVYLLARSLTGNARGAFVAGLLFAFAPYRLAHLPHVQVLSTQWMPFTLYGLHRFFERYESEGGRREEGSPALRPPPSAYIPLAGASAALLLQNLSCGYFLLFFAPVAVAYAAWEVVRRRLAADWRLLASLGASGLAVALATWPFLTPYLALRHLGYGARTFDEVRIFSANVLAYLTGPTWIRGWGRVFDAYLGPEGELFPGLVASVLAVAGIAGSVRAARAATPPAGIPRWRRVAGTVAGTLALAQALLVAYLLAGGSRLLSLGPFDIRMKDFGRTVLLALASVAAWMVISPRARKAGRRVIADSGFWMLAALAAAFLSFGPEIRTGLKEIATGPYLLLYRYVPGFDGLRVPARYGLVVTLMVTVLAARGLDGLLRGRRRAGLVACGLALLFVSEILPVPISINGTGGTERLRPPGPILQGAQVPGAYQYLRALPGKEPVLEFPFGADRYEMQYVYYTTEHGHPIVNGYSGIFPPRYMGLREAFGEGREWEQPWEALTRSGARLVIVHEGAYLRPHEGQRIAQWLEAQGARRLAEFGADIVYRLP